MLWWKGKPVPARFRQGFQQRVELHLFHFGLEVTALQLGRAWASTVIIYIICSASCSEPLSLPTVLLPPSEPCNSPQISDLHVYVWESLYPL